MLKRYWVPSRRSLGFGVTAYSREDAELLLSEAGFVADRDYLWAEAVEDVDVRGLDQLHVIPNMGLPSFRGVWYPCLNLAG
jgi:hypothetical protein